MNDDMIRRGDALQLALAYAHNEAAEKLERAIAVLPAVQPAPDVAGLVEAARGLAEVLNRNGGKGPIHDVELMFCWLAAQTVRAALAALEGRQ